MSSSQHLPHSRVIVIYFYRMLYVTSNRAAYYSQAPRHTCVYSCASTNKNSWIPCCRSGDPSCQLVALWKIIGKVHVWNPSSRLLWGYNTSLPKFHYHIPNAGSFFVRVVGVGLELRGVNEISINCNISTGYASLIGHNNKLCQYSMISTIECAARILDERRLAYHRNTWMRT